MDTKFNETIEYFLNCADKGKVELIVEIYDTKFECVRIADEGGFVKMNREQMVAFWAKYVPGVSLPNMTNAETVPMKHTVIHHTEIIGGLGIVLLTRIKNIGNGWEPMFYNLIWKKINDEWKLLREFVHQKTVPRW